MDVVVLGIDHALQFDDPGLERLIVELVDHHQIGLIAEENRPVADTISKRLAVSKNLPWIQIDMSSEERIKAGIYDKLANRLQIGGYDGDGMPVPAVRYAPVEDGIREEWWLNRIEAAGKRGTVLVVCGCLHCIPFSAKAENRGHTILAKMFYPESLAGLQPEMY